MINRQDRQSENIKRAVTIHPVTRQFKPNLAARLMLKPSDLRRCARWTRYRNHRERSGHPLKFWGNIAVEGEIAALRWRIYELENSRWRDVLGWTTMAEATMIGLRSEAESGKRLPCVLLNRRYVAN